jgi:hypothetical protein
MSAFEFVFSLFGLLLGLSMVEVFQGLIRTLKSRAKLHVGWRTPLLGVLALLHLTTFWDDAWTQRDSIPMNNITLFVGLLISGTYYFAASYVFPEQAEDYPDLDDYYNVARRRVLPGILAAQLLSTTATMAMLGRSPSIRTLIVLALFAMLFLAPALVRSGRTSGFLLCLTTVVFAALAVLSSL